MSKVSEDLMALALMAERLNLLPEDCIDIGIQIGNARLHLSNAKFNACAVMANAVVKRSESMRMSVNSFVWESFEFVTVEHLNEKASHEPVDREATPENAEPVVDHREI